MTLVAFAAAGFGVVTHTAAVTSLSYRKGIFPSWLNILGWIAALFFLISTVGVVTDRNAIAIFGLISFLVWSLWIVLISINLFQRTPTDATP
jgi:hypothetical protein